MCDSRPRNGSNSFEQRCSGKPAGLSAGEGRVLAEARIENEEVRSLANRRNRRTEQRGPAGQMPSKSDGECANLSWILQESGTCSCQPRSGARHRHSALIARGEVQNETPSLYSRQAVACSFNHSFVCVYIGSVINARNGTITHVRTSITVAHAERLSMHICVGTCRRYERAWHAKDKAQANCLLSSAHNEYSHSNDGLCCCGGSSA